MWLERKKYPPIVGKPKIEWKWLGSYVNIFFKKTFGVQIDSFDV
jgi:hypothetical protein